MQQTSCCYPYGSNSHSRAFSDPFHRPRLLAIHSHGSRKTIERSHSLAQHRQSTPRTSQHSFSASEHALPERNQSRNKTIAQVRFAGERTLNRPTSRSRACTNSMRPHLLRSMHQRLAQPWKYNLSTRPTEDSSRRLEASRQRAWS